MSKEQNGFSWKPTGTWKFLKTGWWILHIVGIAAMYTLGNLLWR